MIKRALSSVAIALVAGQFAHAAPASAEPMYDYGMGACATVAAWHAGNCAQSQSHASKAGIEPMYDYGLGAYASIAQWRNAGAMAPDTKIADASPLRLKANAKVN